MSRIGRRPVPIPQGVSIRLDDRVMTVKGPKGELQRTLPGEVTITVEADQVVVTRPSDIGRHRSLHGLTRALIGNMVDGVTAGFKKSLEIRGVGYKAETMAEGVRLIVGYSHPVEFKAPSGVSIDVEGNTTLHVLGIDKEAVGQAAAEIRSVRPPEPYKGKGIRYVGEHVRAKAGKTGAKA